MHTSELSTLLRKALAAEQSKDWSNAAKYYSQAQAWLPGDHRLPTNEGNALWLADEPLAAQAAFARAVNLDPQAALPLRGLGNALRDLNAFEQADDAYKQARLIDDQALTAWNHSQLLLGLERYEQAYASAERRLELAEMLPFRTPPYASPSNHPTLRREPCSEPLHLWSEQGFGDTIQGVRWLTELAARPNAITLEVEHELVPLLEQGLLSSAWPSGPLGARPRIGLAWAAGRKLDDPFTAREYLKRSLPTQALVALVEGLHLAGAELVNLQVGPDREAATELAYPFAAALDHSADFAMTAALVRQLDLVITVDTAMAHLCGALAQPAWVLLPHSADPRWLRDRSDSPWYGSLRLWRQPRRGDWLSVVEAVLAEIKQLV